MKRASRQLGGGASEGLQRASRGLQKGLKGFEQGSKGA